MRNHLYENGKEMDEYYNVSSDSTPKLYNQDNVTLPLLIAECNTSNLNNQHNLGTDYCNNSVCDYSFINELIKMRKNTPINVLQHI